MNLIVSIVTGTYNRLDYLKGMVYSVRSSVGIGLNYEIVVVDGGSVDGTIEWCKTQSDIYLIEQGELLGAVKAFNEGAYSAHGTYVILANDDVQFIDESIMAAVRWMQEHPATGIGCFWQDRGEQDWHVERMTAVVNGNIVHTHYGQVCIVPKWLGDHLGWWGDYLRTYGGDNELSCNVLEAGFRVEPLPCACIHDAAPQDELRAINNPEGGNPDSIKWVRKWTRGGILGPRVRNTPLWQNPIKQEYRILYAPIYERGHPVQKIQKRGLRDALARVGLVVEVDYVERSFNYSIDVAQAWKPHLAVFQIQSVGDVYAEGVKEFRDRNPSCIMYNWNGDYHPENLYNNLYIQLLREFDLNGVVTTAIKEAYDRAGVKWFYHQIGYEEACPDGYDFPSHDVVFLGNAYSGARKDLGKYIRKIGKDLHCNIGLYGSWEPEFKPAGNTLYDFNAGAAIYSKCKMAIGDSQWQNATGFVSNRLFQAMAAGACYLQQWFDGIDTLLGLRDGYHLFIWKEKEELHDLINRLLNDDVTRQIVAQQGQDYILNNHSFDHRVAELLDALHI